MTCRRRPIVANVYPRSEPTARESLAARLDAEQAAWAPGRLTDAEQARAAWLRRVAGITAEISSRR